jgi:hypothetical protein
MRYVDLSLACLATRCPSACLQAFARRRDVLPFRSTAFRLTSRRSAAFFKLPLVIKRLVVWVTCLSALFAPPLSHASGFGNAMKIQTVWIEGNFAYVVSFTTPTPNPDACTRTDKVFLLATNAGFKQMVAQLLLAQAMNTPINFYMSGCQTYWNNDSWPVVISLGTGGP